MRPLTQRDANELVELVLRGCSDAIFRCELPTPKTAEGGPHEPKQRELLAAWHVP
jgi:hypothetical protein